VAAPDHPPDAHAWEYILGGLAILGGGVAALGRRAKRLVVPEPMEAPDYKAWARSFYEEKEASDTRHREAITDELKVLVRAVDRMSDKLDKVVDAIHESNSIVRDANDKTRERVADLVSRLAERAK
jgi:hypothetical protein